MSISVAVSQVPEFFGLKKEKENRRQAFEVQVRALEEEVIAARVALQGKEAEFSRSQAVVERELEKHDATAEALEEVHRLTTVRRWRPHLPTQ